MAKDGRRGPQVEDVAAELENDRNNAIKSFVFWVILSLVAICCLLLAVASNMVLVD